MLKIGITGSIGAGKSFVGELLRASNFRVLDADRKVHELYRDCAELRAEMASFFGEGCLTPTGVNSALVADRIFADASAREKLEQIVYPYRLRFFRALHRLWECSMKSGLSMLPKIFACNVLLLAGLAKMMLLDALKISVAPALRNCSRANRFVQLRMMGTVFV